MKSSRMLLRVSADHGTGARTYALRRITDEV